MDKVIDLNGILITPLKVVPHPLGDIFHGMKKSDPGFNGFGEIYLSTIKQDTIKAWKMHKEMTLNLIVIKGMIRFVFYDNRSSSPTQGIFAEHILSISNYSRVTVPPMIWMGFEGLGTENVLINVANLEHRPDEIERCELVNDLFSFEWKTVK